VSVTIVRILYLSDIRFPLERANGIQTMETCHALASRGHEVTLLVRPDTQTPPRDPFDYYGLPADRRLRVQHIVPRGGARMRRARYLIVSWREARRGRHDIVFTRDLGVASALLRIGRPVRRPLVYESHGLAAVVGASLGSLVSTGRSASARKQRRLWAREQRVWQHADGYVAITAALAQELEAHFGPRDNLAVVPDGVRLPEARPSAPVLPATSPCLAYAGHLYPWKGVDTFVRALVHLPEARGLIVGGHPGEPDLARLQRLAAELHLSGRITFTGLVAPAHVAGFLQQADVLVLPNSATAISARYSSPLKLFEYLAAGRPIIASDLPAFREVLRDGANALLVPADNAGAIAGAVRRLAADPDLARTLAGTAAEEATLYTWEARAARLESLMKHVAG
jgi:glycosyltransferase involved in cell wall biosynthesis